MHWTWTDITVLTLAFVVGMLVVDLAQRAMDIARDWYRARKSRREDPPWWEVQR